MTTKFQEPQNPMQTDNYWQHGRVVVHASGEAAGSMRLDMDLEGIDSAERAKEIVKLIIPGETSPLDALQAVGERGRFVVSFFSSDIANAGHLPAEAVARWDADGSERQTHAVDVVAAEEVAVRQGEEAANVPGGKPSGMYPKTVGLLAVMAVVFLMMCVVAVLLIK